MRRASVLTAVLTVSLGTAAVSGSIVAATDYIDAGNPPLSVRLGELENDTAIIAFQEILPTELPNSFALDISMPGTYTIGTDAWSPGSVSAGTMVQSYYLHLDPVDQHDITLWGTIQFDVDVLGFVLTADGVSDSDLLLGSPTTEYEACRARGLEDDDVVSLSSDRRTVTASLHAGEYLDSIRIITAVPEPLTSLLFALAGLPMLRRRQS